MKNKCAGVILSAGLLASGYAQAQNTDEDMCRNGLFPSQQEFHIASVAATASRLYFFNDWDGCPHKGASCRTNAYVLSGDRLLLGKTHGEWTCAWYQGKSHETVGWVRNQDLVVQAPAPVQAADWTGTWKDGYKGPGKVRIERQGSAWHVDGETRWIGQNTENYGGMSGPLEVSGERARLSPAAGEEEFACGASMVRIGEFLIVHDNGQCGGINVRFDGVYLRAL
jgi:hypothetical protein